MNQAAPQSHRADGCGGKKRYETKEAAKEAASLKPKSGKAKANAYYCFQCYFWHVGNNQGKPWLKGTGHSGCPTPDDWAELREKEDGTKKFPSHADDRQRG